MVPALFAWCVSAIWVSKQMCTCVSLQEKSCKHIFFQILSSFPSGPKIELYNHLWLSGHLLGSPTAGNSSARLRTRWMLQWVHPVPSDLWHKQTVHSLLVSSLLCLMGMSSWIIRWVGDVLGLIFCDRVKREEARKGGKKLLLKTDYWH